jgi:hypothetical protein
MGNEPVIEEAGSERDKPAFLDSMVVKGAGMMLAGGATAALVAATGAAGKSQMAVQGLGAMAAGTPGATTAATQGIGMAQSGAEILSESDSLSAASDVIGGSNNQFSSITDLAQDEFDFGNLGDIVSAESDLDDHKKPAIRGLGPS